MSNCLQLQNSLSSLFDLQGKYLEAFSDVVENKGHRDPGNKQKIEFSLVLREEIQLAIQEVENYLCVSLQQAQEIMDREGEKNFMGPEQVKIAFGIEVKDIPKIHFSREELERARELDQMLVLRVDKAPDGQPLTMEKIYGLLQGQTKDGKKILYNYDETKNKMKEECWYKEESFLTIDSPQPGWALVSKEIIPDSINSNYLVQTDKLIAYLTNQVFKGQEIPKIYQQAIKEFKEVRQQENLDELITQDRKKASQILEDLQITQLLRQSPAETLYDLMFYFQNTGQRLLEDTYTWSRRCDSDDKLVNVGGFLTIGVSVRSCRLVSSDGNLGVCLSRRS